MGLDQHRAQITAEWLDTATGHRRRRLRTLHIQRHTFWGACDVSVGALTV
jgi:hypothetical protein